MVKHNNEWGTVCDDGFTYTSAKAACHTLGLRGGSYATGRNKVTHTRVWIDDVKCASSTTNFLQCSHRGLGTLRSCNGHQEDILLYCS